MKLLQDLSYSQIKLLVEEAGFPSYRAEQINAVRISNREYSASSNLPKKVAEYFSASYATPACTIAETVSGKGVGAFLTTGATTDGGVPHGDLISKEQRKESETERKSL